MCLDVPENLFSLSSLLSSPDGQGNVSGSPAAQWARISGQHILIGMRGPEDGFRVGCSDPRLCMGC